MHDTADLSGVILAGGLSRRMGGPEKSLILLENKPLVEHVRDRLAGQTSRVVLNANGDLKRFDFLGLWVIADTIGGFAGPLAGVLAGLRWAQSNSASAWVLTVAADTPFFPSNYASRMKAKAPGNKIVLARSGGRNHPVFGLWHTSVADGLEDFLVNGGRKVMMFVAQHANSLVDFTQAGPDPFFNVNTPEDLEKARTLLVGGPNDA